MAADSFSDDGRGATTRMPGCRSPGSVIDHGVLETLVDDLGDVAATVMVVKLYLRELDGRYDAVAAAIRSGDLACAQRDAHTLKAPSLMLGASELGTVCGAIETASVELTNQLVTDLGQLVKSARSGLETWIGEASSTS